jgi:type IV pilus assembly protein PilM
VSVRRGQVVLERIGQAGLPDGAVVDGEVKDPAVVAAALKDLWRRTRISSRRVIIGVANQRVVVRLVDVPWMPPNELRSSPPYVMDIADTPYRISQWAEIRNPGGLPA